MAYDKLNILNKNDYYFELQRWSRGHKAQGQRQLFRGQTLSRPRTGMLKAKDTAASVLQKKKGLQKSFSGNLQVIGVARILVSLHRAEKHLPENHLPEKHFPERSFSRINIYQKWHLPKITSARMNTCLKLHLSEWTLVWNYICQNEHLPEITSIWMNTCLKLHLPEWTLAWINDIKLDDPKLRECAHFILCLVTLGCRPHSSGFLWLWRLVFSLKKVGWSANNVLAK